MKKSQRPKKIATIVRVKKKIEISKEKLVIVYGRIITYCWVFLWNQVDPGTQTALILPLSSESVMGKQI